MTSRPTRTAIVTGGAKRIGGAITRALAGDGWHVLIHCNTSRAAADALAAELPHASVVTADLADPVAAETIMAATLGLPPAQLLVNSASRFVYDRIEDFSAAEDELSHLHWIGLDAVRTLDLPFITEVVLAEVTTLLAGIDQPGVPFFDNSGSVPTFRRIA